MTLAAPEPLTPKNPYCEPNPPRSRMSIIALTSGVGSLLSLPQRSYRRVTSLRAPHVRKADQPRPRDDHGEPYPHPQCLPRHGAPLYYVHPLQEENHPAEYQNAAENPEYANHLFTLFVLYIAWGIPT